jgi:hypothetical protein
MHSERKRLYWRSLISARLLIGDAYLKNMAAPSASTLGIVGIADGSTLGPGRMGEAVTLFR